MSRVIGTIKALTIHQPYAHLIITPVDELPIGSTPKRVENRSWPTNYRGPLLIHAGRSLKWINQGDWPHFLPDKKTTYEDFPEFAFGAFVGVVRLVDCIHLKDVENYPPKWVKSHCHTEGPYCWILDSPQRFDDPIPFRGRQGLFNVVVDTELANELKGLDS